VDLGVVVVDGTETLDCLVVVVFVVGGSVIELGLFGTLVVVDPPRHPLGPHVLPAPQTLQAVPRVHWALLLLVVQQTASET